MTPGPGKGFNLVAVDPFEELGRELYFIEHYDTREEADAALKDFKKSSTDAVYIYGGDD